MFVCVYGKTNLNIPLLTIFNLVIDFGATLGATHHVCVSGVFKSTDTLYSENLNTRKSYHRIVPRNPVMNKKVFHIS